MNQTKNPYAHLVADLTPSPVRISISEAQYGQMKSLARRRNAHQNVEDRVHDGIVSALEALNRGKFKGDIDDARALMGYINGHIKFAGANRARKESRTVAAGDKTEVLDARVYADAGRDFDNPERQVSNAQLLGKLWPRVKQSPELLAQVVHGDAGTNTEAKRRSRARADLAALFGDDVTEFQG